MLRKLKKREWRQVARHFRSVVFHLNKMRAILVKTCDRRAAFSLNVLSKSMTATKGWIISKADDQDKNHAKLNSILDVKIDRWVMPEDGKP